MTERLRLILPNAQEGHVRLQTAWTWAKPLLVIGHRLHLALSRATRTNEQNALMWALLDDISGQVQWPVNGRLEWLDSEDWKHIISGGLHREQRIAQGINGGWVVLGRRTSKMTKAEMADLLELIQAFGAEHGVRFSAPEYREAA